MGAFFAFLLVLCSVESVLSGQRRKKQSPSSSLSARESSVESHLLHHSTMTTVTACYVASFSILSGSRKAMGGVMSLQGSPDQKRGDRYRPVEFLCFYCPWRGCKPWFWGSKRCISRRVKRRSALAPCNDSWYIQLV